MSPDDRVGPAAAKRARPLARRLGGGDRRDPVERIARLTHRLAALLAGGVPPSSAWSYLEEPIADRIAEGARRGAPVAGAIETAAATLPGEEARAWRILAAAWAVAAESGAPLAPTLERFAATLRSLAQARRDADVALAGPSATARLVLALPCVSVLFGLALGFDTMGVLLRSSLGWACLAIGLALLVLGATWSRRLVRSATPAAISPGLASDLLAVAVSGGAPLDRARALVARRLEPLGEPMGEGDEVLELARRAGVPAADLLRAEAGEARRRAASELERRVARLSVTLMIPLGVCVLPAFVVLGVVPMLVSVVTTTVLAP